MKQLFFILALLLPTSAFAATPPTPSFSAARDLIVASTTPGNQYEAAGTLAVSAPTAGDLSALAGSMLIGAPVSGDALLAGGVITLNAPVAGDMRAVGGRILVDAPVTGDEVLFGGSVEDSGGAARDTFVVAANATLAAGAKGPVTVYANNVSLAGDFTGDVRVVAAGSVTLEPGTIIHGSLLYQAPERASIASSAVVKGGVTYTGASYLPTSSEAHALAFAAVGVFLLVKILGALILAGLIAGLFPVLADAIARESCDRSPRGLLLTTLLGFAILVATPVLLLLLALTFVGLGIALVLGVAYLLLSILAFVYTGIIVGAALARRFAKRENVYWRDAVLGTFVVFIIGSIPFIGFPLVLILAAFAEGALIRIFYRFAFSQEDDTARLL